MNNINKKIKNLSKYTWGLGIEHEMHIFHIPFETNKKIKDFIIFDSKKVIEKLLDEKNNKNNLLSLDDVNFLKTVPYELSGRKCNGVSVIEAVPIQMPEFITNFPFCSIKNNRNLKNMGLEIINSKNRFYDILMRDKDTQKLVKKYGSFQEYPFGMTRYLKCPINEKKGKYIFKKNKEGNDILLPEYNGSFHITFTLPYTEKTSNTDFIKMHQNFSNQLQWLEPLLLTAYFSGDEYAPGSLNKRVRGSFRVMIIGWGNFAGSDVKLYKKGIGRYAKTPTYWRKGLKFIDSDKLKPCYKPSPIALKEGAISCLSSDFRTFGNTDPNRPEHRISGAPMNKPNGIEFRIFDQFADFNLSSLLMLISLVAENSRVTKTRGYVYQNKIWIQELHNIMKYGYRAKLSKNYIKLLRKKLDIEINTNSIIAYDIFKQIFIELYLKNVNGDWMKIFYCNEKLDLKKIIIPEINKKSWQFSFMIKLNRTPELLHKFNVLINYLNYKININFKEFYKAVIDIFGNNWKDDVEDIAYFLENLYDEFNINLKIGNNQNKYKYVILIKNRDGIINELKVMNKIPKQINFNIELLNNFNK